MAVTHYCSDRGAAMRASRTGAVRPPKLRKHAMLPTLPSFAEDGLSVADQ
jgi:hypothetical protein